MHDYYEENWKEYHEATVGIDPSSFLAPLLARITPPAAILDVGCGSGRDMLWFRERGFRVTGFERSPSLAELARKHSGCPVIEGNFEVYDFSDQNADALILVGALVHIPHDRFNEILENVLRALREGGHVLITMKEGRDLTETSHGRIFHLWQDSDLRKIFNQMKLTIVDFSRQVSRLRESDIWLGYVLRKDESTI